MKQFRDKERQEPVSNGYAHDIGTEAETKVREMANMASPEVKGFLTLAGGLLLLAHTLGYLPVLNWALMAASVAAIFYGANSSHLWSRTKQVAEYVKNMVSGTDRSSDRSNR